MKNYQEEALKTWLTLDKNISANLTYLSLGLASETGEVVGKLAKLIRDNNSEICQYNKDQIALELGDCLWFISVIAKELGFSLEEIQERNIGKLRSRQLRNKINGDGDYR